MKLSQVGAQLYTLRDFCKTATDLAKTAKKVRDIGYPAVQVSGIGPIDPSEVRQIMADAGLVICSTHEASAMICNEPEKAIERVKAMGSKQSAYPAPHIKDLTDLRQLKSLICDLDRAGAMFRENGITLSYHNHGTEFIRVEGMTILERFLRESAAENLSFELDTYWVQYGGGDPVDWCQRVKGRLHLLHLKDYGFDPVTRAPIYREIGQGNLNFPAIIKSAEQSGCEWFVVEQDTCPGDPFDSLKISFDYIRDHLVTES